MTEFKAGDRVRRTDNADEGVVDDFNRNDVFVLFDNGNRLWVPSHRITPTAPTPAWVPTAGEWAAVRVHGFPASNPQLVEIERPGKGTSLMFADALRPLPSMAAEDVAVLRAAEEMEMRRSDLSESDSDAIRYDAFAEARSKFQAAVRARAKPAQEAPTTEKQRWGETTAAAFSDQAQRVAAAEKAVVEAAMEWRSGIKRDDVEIRRLSPGAQSLTHATDALRALTQPEPIDPVTELRESAAAVAERADRAGIRTSSMWEEQLRRIARLRAALAAMERTPGTRRSP